MANTRVILTVNTETIATDKSYKYADSVEFSDNRGSRPGNGNKFDSKINKNKKISWEARTFSNPYDEKFVGNTIEITEVKHTYGDVLIENITYPGKKAKADVKSGLQDGLMEWYSITFEVNDGSTVEEYTIDPKMHT